MKEKVLLLTVCLTTFSGLWGCQKEQGKVLSDSVLSARAEETEFPEFLVGTWRSNESRWVLTLEPDGSISKMKHFGGMEFDVAEGGLVEHWRDNAEAIYALGPCEAEYESQTRELTVTIVIEHYIINFSDGSLEGSFYDYLTGPISEDGLTWNASWTSRGEIIGSGSSTVGPKKLTFTKVMDNVMD